MNKRFSNRDLLVLILPLMLETGLNILIGMADTMMVARAGESAVTAVSLVDSISYLLITLFTAFATGGTVICSQYIGNGQDDKAKDSAKNLIYISAFLGMLLPVLIIPMKMGIIKTVFGTITDEVASLADGYFLYVALSYPFLAIYSAYTALSRAEGNTKRTLYVALVMNVINITGNAILIIGYGMGPKGAGIATLISRIIGAGILASISIIKKSKLSTSGLLKGPFSPALISKIARVGIPSGIEGSFFHVGKISVLSMVSALGTSAVAINTVVNNYNAYCNITGTSVGIAMITVIGQLRGNGDFEGIKYYTRKLMGILFVTSIATCIPLYIFSPEVISLYGLESENIKAAIPIARSCLIACSTIWPFGFCLPNSLKAVGDVKFIMTLSLSSMFAIRVFGAYIFIVHLGFGVWGVWCAMYLDWIFRGILYTIRYRKGKWKSISLI